MRAAILLSKATGVKISNSKSMLLSGSVVALSTPASLSGAPAVLPVTQWSDALRCTAIPCGGADEKAMVQMRDCGASSWLPDGSALIPLCAGLLVFRARGWWS